MQMRHQVQHLHAREAGPGEALWLDALPHAWSVLPRSQDRHRRRVGAFRRARDDAPNTYGRGLPVGCVTRPFEVPDRVEPGEKTPSLLIGGNWIHHAVCRLPRFPARNPAPAVVSARVPVSSLRWRCGNLSAYHRPPAALNNQKHRLDFVMVQRPVARLL